MRGIDETFSVYVVDDDDAVRDSLAALLEPEGFVVKAFPSADQFLNDLRSCHPGDGGPACVLLDLHMPGKGGQELLDAIVKLEGNLPVVVLTGNADGKTRRRALAAGAVAFLEKPVDADCLIDTLRGAVDENS